jgi:hypothetical protein
MAAAVTMVRTCMTIVTQCCSDDNNNYNNDNTWPHTTEVTCLVYNSAMVNNKNNKPQSTATMAAATST